MYSRREFLENDTDYTSSAVSYHDGDSLFLELADCRSKIRLHANIETQIGRKQFIRKLKRLRKHITKFIKYLEFNL